MVERIARCEQTYGDKKVTAGEKFLVEPQHVIVLLALGKIEAEEGEYGYTPRSIGSHEEVPQRSRRNGARGR